jgi:hypothetical protein
MDVSSSAVSYRRCPRLCDFLEWLVWEVPGAGVKSRGAPCSNVVRSFLGMSSVIRTYVCLRSINSYIRIHV